MGTVLTITPNGVTENPSHIKLKSIGTKKFGNKIDITDPVYSRDVWCRMNDVEIAPGDYECYIETLDDEATDGMGERVSCIGIRNTEYVTGTWTLVYEYIGVVGVDSGLAGFFNHKPDYTSKEWSEMCKFLSTTESTQSAWIHDDGFFSSSGYGDGGYNVFAAKKNGKIVALYIEFIDPDDEDLN